jgi:hypothetical protein
MMAHDNANIARGGAASDPSQWIDCATHTIHGAADKKKKKQEVNVQ